jgi:hypothetical protein
MKAEQVMTLAINTIKRWNDEYLEAGETLDLISVANLSFLESELKTIHAAGSNKNLWTQNTRYALQLAYAILDSN